MHLIHAVCFVIAFTTPGGHANNATQAQRVRVELDEKMVRETVETVAFIVSDRLGGCTPIVSAKSPLPFRTSQVLRPLDQREHFAGSGF